MEKELLNEKEKLYSAEDLVGKGGKFLVLTANDSTVYCRERFTEEQKMIANSALDFARKQIKPVSERLNKTLDEEIYKRMTKDNCSRRGKKRRKKGR